MRHAKPLVMGHGFFLKRFFLVIKALVMNNGSRLIRAGDGAGCAANTQIIIHGYETISALFSRAGRADRDTRGFCAMLTAGYQKNPFYVRVRTGFYIKDPPPLNAWNGVIGVFTCHRAGLATNTSVNINDHAPAGRLAVFRRYVVHQWPPVLIVDMSLGGPSPRVIFIRARSDPLPVESVSFRDSDVREFRLGKLRSSA